MSRAILNINSKLLVSVIFNSLVVFLSVNAVQILHKCIILLFINVDVIVTLLEYLHFVLFQHNHIDPSRCFKGFVIEVKIIMQLHPQDETAEQQSMHVEPGQTEVLVLYDVAIHYYDRHNQTLRWKLCQFVNSPQIILDCNVGHLLTVEDCLTAV